MCLFQDILFTLVLNQNQTGTRGVFYDEQKDEDDGMA